MILLILATMATNVFLLCHVIWSVSIEKHLKSNVSHCIAKPVHASLWKGGPREWRVIPDGDGDAAFCYLPTETKLKEREEEDV